VGEAPAVGVPTGVPMGLPCSEAPVPSDRGPLDSRSITGICACHQQARIRLRFITDFIVGPSPD
jgi:hypothetical protein